MYTTNTYCSVCGEGIRYGAFVEEKVRQKSEAVLCGRRVLAHAVRLPLLLVLT